MNKIDQFQQILTKEMSRKEFLQHVGVFIVGALGITSIMDNFMKLSYFKSGNPASNSQKSNGYGNGSYGQ